MNNTNVSSACTEGNHRGEAIGATGQPFLFTVAQKDVSKGGRV